MELGEPVLGDGFLVRSPEAYLYPKENFPTKGGITLRPTITLLDGLVYYVTPFSSTTSKSASEALDEWNENPKRKGKNLSILERKSTLFQGLNSEQAIVEVLNHNQQGGYIAAITIVEREANFLIFSFGDGYTLPSDRNKTIQRSKEGLQKLSSSIELK